MMCKDPECICYDEDNAIALRDYERLEDENASLRAEAEKDYEDMRRFQKAYIEADQECRHLRAERDEAVRLLKSCLNGLSYMDRTEARAFLARLEVR
jgi:hypothetical protein